MRDVTVATAPDWSISFDNPNVNVVEWDLKSDPPVDHIDIVVSAHATPKDIVERVSGTGASLLQLGSIGYDSISTDLPEGMVVANAATVHETATSEHALAMILYAAREFDRSLAAQADGRWDSFYSKGLADSHVVLVGIGGVGGAIARRLHPFEVEVSRVASHSRSDMYGYVYGIDELPDLLPTADVVVVVVPHNDSTHHLVDDTFLTAMKDGAILVNVARGKVADTDALLRHADRIRLALDVTDPEPLPEGHPLYEKAVLVTAHNGGNAQAMYKRMTALVRRQVGHLLNGEHFDNVVLGTEVEYRA